MPIKEQFARVWLVTMVLTYAAYFAAVVYVGDTTAWNQIVMFAVTTIVQVIVIGTASAIMAVRHKRGPAADERDQMIDQRATRVAYALLICGMILVGCLMPFNNNGWTIFHAAVLSIAIAEIVRHGLMVAMYRRGWDG
jgi:peptidoglycan/LPS O-acetylase OafA/YrhL